MNSGYDFFKGVSFKTHEELISDARDELKAHYETRETLENQKAQACFEVKKQIDKDYESRMEVLHASACVEAKKSREANNFKVLIQMIGEKDEALKQAEEKHLREHHSELYKQIKQCDAKIQQLLLKLKRLEALLKQKRTSTQGYGAIPYAPVKTTKKNKNAEEFMQRFRR